MSRSANAAQARRWNAESGWYWIANRERHLAEHRNLMPHLFDAAGISRGERVLDVGCGCGETTITAARAAGATGPGPVGLAVGLDLSHPMLEVARRLAGKAGVPNAGFVRGDAQACPLRPASYDLLISSFGVMFFADPAAAFTSLAGAVRPGGRLAFLCWQHDAHNELLAIPVRAFGGHIPGPTTGELFFDPRQVTDLLSGTGWADVRIAAVSEPAWMGTDVADVMSYIEGMPMLRGLPESLGDESLAERALAAIAEEYAERQRPDGVWVRAAAWLVTAHRA